jgi:uncharacterized protein YcbX
VDTQAVTKLSVTPIKGLGMSLEQEIHLTETGAVGDRQLFLADDDDRLFSVTRSGTHLSSRARLEPGGGLVVTFPGETLSGSIVAGTPIEVAFPDRRTVSGRIVEGNWGEAFSERAGQQLRLVMADRDNAGCDVYPVTLLGDASVAELARRSDLAAVDHRRFRMTIGFSGTVPHIEDTWTGRELAIGGAVLRVAGPTPRCNAITRHPERGDTNLKALRLIKDYRGLATIDNRSAIPFGVYAVVVQPGPVALGDALELL